MKYLLDTNACIRYLNGRAPKLVQKIHTTPREEIVTSIITKAELYYGSEKSQTREASRKRQDEFLATFPPVPLDNPAVEQYAKIRASLETRGTPIGYADMLIASIALANDLFLITHNTREFSRVEGLQIEDWEI